PFELADRERSGEAVDLIGEIVGQRRSIEAVRRADLGGPRKRGLTVHPGSTHARPEKKGMSAAAVSEGFSSARKCPESMARPSADSHQLCQIAIESAA